MRCLSSPLNVTTSIPTFTSLHAVQKPPQRTQISQRRSNQFCPGALSDYLILNLYRDKVSMKCSIDVGRSLSINKYVKTQEHRKWNSRAQAPTSTLCDGMNDSLALEPRIWNMVRSNIYVRDTRTRDTRSRRSTRCIITIAWHLSSLGRFFNFAITSDEWNEHLAQMQFEGFSHLIARTLFSASPSNYRIKGTIKIERTWCLNTSNNF